MKRVLRGALVAAALLGASAPALAQSGACNRACLTGKLDQFMKAVVAHDPGQAPLFVGFRQTQNAVITAPGEGIWKTNTGIGSVDSRYYDPVTGNAEFFGTLKEGDQVAIVSARIKVAGQQITEAEWHVARKDDDGMMGPPTKTLFDAEKLASMPPPQRVVPPAQRASREALLAAVNSYFDGIVLGSGRYVQANPGCFRLENGQGVSGTGVSRPLSPADASFQTSNDCRTGYAGLNIANVGGRRYLLVDMEQQIVVASMVFVRTPNNPKRRNHFMEVFVMDGGKISGVYASMMYADPALPLPNWEPYESNFPLSPPMIAAH